MGSRHLPAGRQSAYGGEISREVHSPRCTLRKCDIGLQGYYRYHRATNTSTRNGSYSERMVKSPPVSCAIDIYASGCRGETRVQTSSRGHVAAVKVRGMNWHVNHVENEFSGPENRSLFLSLGTIVFKDRFRVVMRLKSRDDAANDAPKL